MKERLLDPKIISEVHDPEGREQILNSTSSLESELKEIENNIPLHEAKKIELSEKLNTLEKEAEETVSVLADRLKTLIVRIKIKLGLNDEVVSNLNERNETIAKEKEALIQELDQIEIEIENLKKRLKELPTPQEFLNAYHEKMLEVPLTNEEKRELLKPETLASLSTEEYIQLWRRLNPHFLSHVTRQGIRDHNAMIYHSAGMNKFHNGFLGTMNGGREIKTPFAVKGLEFENEEAINNFLQKNRVFETQDISERWEKWKKDNSDYELDYVIHKFANDTNQEEKIDEEVLISILQEKMSLYRLKSLLTSGVSSYQFPDETAVHFASLEVADSYYGGEKNNEIFFLFPTDVIASQYNLSGPNSFTVPNKNIMYNDVYVWPNSTKESGIPTDMGFVFLPNNTMVDPETGSKYATKIVSVDGTETRIAVEDKDLEKKFIEWLSSLDQNSLLITVIRDWIDEKDLFKLPQKKEYFDKLLQEELKKIGFGADTLSELTTFLESKFLEKLEKSDHNFQMDKKIIDEIIKTYSGGKKRAENPITAKEYWEKYFNEHPDIKPKHIVYYDGDPTTAVHEFLRKNKIGRADTSEKDGKFLGFDDKYVQDMKQDPRANKGYNELLETAQKIIHEYYTNKTSNNS